MNNKIKSRKNSFSKGIIMDTKPFTLFMIGLMDINLIERYKGIQGYDVSHFEELLIIFNESKKIYITPYVACEFSHFTFDVSLGKSYNKSLNMDYRIRLKELMIKMIDNKIIEIDFRLTKLLSEKSVVRLGFSDISNYFGSLDKNIPIITSDGILADFIRSAGGISIKFLETKGIVDY